MEIQGYTNNGIKGYQIFDEEGNEYFITEETEQLALQKYNEIKERENNPLTSLEFQNENLLGLSECESILERIGDVAEHELTTEQEIKYNKVYNRKLKLETRKEFAKEVGDLPDQVADIDKQQQCITPIVIRMFLFNLELLQKLDDLNLLDKDEFLDSLSDKEIINENLIGEYKTFGEGYINAIAAGIYVDRVDVEPDPEAMINNIMTNNIKKGYLANQYLTNKRT